MGRLGSWLRAGVAATLLTAAACALFTGCREPTQITVVLSTDVACSRVVETTLAVGTLSNLNGKPPVADQPGCKNDASGRIGSLVVVPSGDNDAELALLAVMAVDDTSAASCDPEKPGPKCVVARRALRYVPHTPLFLPIELSASCLGVQCGPDQTCYQGQCVDPKIPDPEQCTNLEQCVPQLPPADGGPDALLDVALDVPLDLPLEGLGDVLVFDGPNLGCGDQLQNGTETDVDCGGGLCWPCALGKSCVLGTDCISGVCGPKQRCADKSMVLHYPFETNAAFDASYHGNDGQPSGTQWMPGSGRNGSGEMLFAATSSATIYVPSSASILAITPLTGVTFAAWVRPTAAASMSLGGAIIASADYDVYLELDAGTTIPCAVVGANQACGSAIPIGTGAAHVAMTFDTATGLRLYVNGAMAPGGNGGAFSLVDGLFIGYGLNAGLDDVKIFNRVLDDVEIAQLAK